MASFTTRALATAAAVFGGLLAGMAVDRAIVQLPAWELVGADAWRAFTLRADLTRGMVIYPAEGVLALLASVAALVAWRLDRAAARRAVLPLALAALLSMAAFVVTARVVAPQLLRLRQAPDAAGLAALLAAVTRWWWVKATLHAATFLANVWSVVALGGSR